MKDSFESVLEAFSQGEFVIVFDEHREEEADFFVLAESITAEKINFLFEFARGMICTACEESILQKLEIDPMVQKNQNQHGTNFGVLVDAANDITTGVSAGDRAKTIQVLANPKSTPKDLVRPGHTAPLFAKPISQRFGHTEAAVELAKKAEKYPAVVICEILNHEGEKASMYEVRDLAERFGIKSTTLENLKEQFQ